MKIVTLTPADEALIQQAATVLVDAFHWLPNTWSTLDDALTELEGLLAPGHLVRAAIDGDGQLVGWVGAIQEYDGHAWELHPLAVRPDRQRQGIGRTLVTDLAELLRDRGVTTLYLGTDDETNATNISQVDLYPNIPGFIAGIENYHGHPFEFYQKCGFTIYGLLPDANGPGKPDILMARRLAPGPAASGAPPVAAPVAVRSLVAAAATAMRESLADLLCAVVNGGASVGFVPPLDAAAALAYWDGVIAALDGAGRVLLVAETPAGGVVGTAQLLPASNPNGKQRAEVAKVMVHPGFRRLGIGAALMAVLEAEARAAGRTTLVLDTRAGEPSELLYRRLGYQAAGIIPDFALSADGSLHATVYYYKLLR